MDKLAATMILMETKASALMRVLAGSLRIDTLAAIVNDLAECDQCDDRSQMIADAAKDLARQQIVSMCGQTGAARYVSVE